MLELIWILFVIKVNFSCSSNDHIGPSIVYTIEPKIVITFWACGSIFFIHTLSFSHPFLEACLTTYYSNVVVYEQKLSTLRSRSQEARSPKQPLVDLKFKLKLEVWFHIIYEVSSWVETAKIWLDNNATLDTFIFWYLESRPEYKFLRFKIIAVLTNRISQFWIFFSLQPYCKSTLSTLQLELMRQPRGSVLERGQS